MSYLTRYILVQHPMSRASEGGMPMFKVHEAYMDPTGTEIEHVCPAPIPLQHYDIYQLQHVVHQIAKVVDGAIAGTNTGTHFFQRNDVAHHLIRERSPA